MRLSVGTEVIGLEHVLGGTEALGRVLRTAPVRKGLRLAGRHLVSVGQGNLRRLYKGYQSGRLLRSMGTRLKRRQPGALAGFRRGQGGGNHAHLVDLGTKRRYTKLGKHRGTMPGNRFWTQTKQSASSAAGRHVLRGIEEAVLSIK